MVTAGQFSAVVKSTYKSMSLVDGKGCNTAPA